MSEQPDPNEPVVNPSVEASKVDDARAKKLHEEEEVAAGVAGTGIGCLGILLLPWAWVALAVIAGVAFIVVAKMVHW